MKKFFYVAATALVLTTSANAAIMIDGYIDAGYSNIEDSFRGGSGLSIPLQATTSMNGFQSTNSQFNVNEVNLDISADLSDRMRVFTSWDATDAASSSGTGYSLVADYAYIEWANPAGFDLNVRLGIVPSIIGVEQRVAESNQNDFATLSLASPYTVGSLEGLTLSGTWSPINWAIQYTNDDPLGGASITSAVGDINQPTNSNGLFSAVENEHSRNIGGRLGVVPLEGLEIGVSAWTSRTNPTGAGVVGSSPKQDRTGFGVDLGYTYGALKLGGEYYRLKEDAALVQTADDDAKTWYLYATYDVMDAVTVGARYSELDIDVSGANDRADHDVSTISLLGKYNLTRDVAVKAQYDINDEDELTGAINVNNQEVENDAFMISVVASF